MLRIILSLFFFVYAYASNSRDGSSNKEKLFRAVLVESNPNHQFFLDLMNVETEQDRAFQNELRKNGYLCIFSKFDIVFKNNSGSLKKLLDSNNKDIVEEATKNFKIKLHEVIEHLSVVISLEDLRSRYETVLKDYVIQLGSEFFGGNNVNILNKGSMIQTPEMEPKLTNNFDNDSAEQNVEGSDLSIQGGDNEKTSKNVSRLSYSYESYSSTYVDKSDESEETSEDKPLTAEDALATLIKNSVLVFEGVCNKEDSLEKDNQPSMIFGSKISNNSFSITCGLSGNEGKDNCFLRKGDAKNFLNLINNKASMNQLMENLFKLLDSTFGNNQMKNPLFLKNLMSGNLEGVESVDDAEEENESSTEGEDENDGQEETNTSTSNGDDN